MDFIKINNLPRQGNTLAGNALNRRSSGISDAEICVIRKLKLHEPVRLMGDRKLQDIPIECNCLTGQSLLTQV